MTISEFRELVGRPESESLEVKLDVPSGRIVGRLISAFANTKGGSLVVGVDDSGEVTGIEDTEGAQNALEQALQSLSPRPELRSEIVEVEGRRTYVISVSKSPTPVAFNNTVYERVGEMVVPRIPSMRQMCMNLLTRLW
jgi:predicted HTH transcriptional regulator